MQIDLSMDVIAKNLRTFVYGDSTQKNEEEAYGIGEHNTGAILWNASTVVLVAAVAISIFNGPIAFFALAAVSGHMLRSYGQRLLDPDPDAPIKILEFWPWINLKEMPSAGEDVDSSSADQPGNPYFNRPPGSLSSSSCSSSSSSLSTYPRSNYHRPFIPPIIPPTFRGNRNNQGVPYLSVSSSSSSSSSSNSSSSLSSEEGESLDTHSNRLTGVSLNQAPIFDPYNLSSSISYS